MHWCRKAIPSLAPLAGPAIVLVLVWMVVHAGEFDPLQIQRHADGSVTLRLEGEPGSIQRIESSGDLGVWSPIVTLQLPAAGRVDLDQAGGDGLRQYYRAVPLGPTALTGDHLNTQLGDVLIHPVNHASFIMQWAGKTIYNDPVGAASSFGGIPPADLILVGHRHSDHWSSSTVNSLIKAESVFIAPQDVYDLMSAPIKARTTVLANGASTELLGLKVEAIPAYNSNHPQGRHDNGYVLTIGGRRIYLSGDTADIAEMRALRDIDVAFIAMNVPYTMSVDQAASAILEFRPKVVYPYHYRNQNGTFADFDRLQGLLGADAEIGLRLRDWY